MFYSLTVSNSLLLKCRVNNFILLVISDDPGFLYQIDHRSEVAVGDE